MSLQNLVLSLLISRGVCEAHTGFVIFAHDIHRPTRPCELGGWQTLVSSQPYSCIEALEIKSHYHLEVL